MVIQKIVVYCEGKRFYYQLLLKNNIMTKNQKKQWAITLGKEYRYDGKSKKGYFVNRTGRDKNKVNIKLNQKISKGL